MRLDVKYSSYAYKLKLFVSLFFVYKNISHSILFKPCNISTTFRLYLLAYFYTHIARCFKNFCKMYLLLFFVTFKSNIGVRKYFLPNYTH